MFSGDSADAVTPDRYRGEERRRSPPPEDRGGGAALPRAAWGYLASVYATAGGFYALVIASRSVAAGADQLLPFGVLAALATTSQLFMVEAPSRHSYHVTPAFLLAAAMLMDPGLLGPLVVISLLPEWRRYRYPWYIQTFNIATYGLNVLAAWSAFAWFAPAGVSLSPQAALGAGAAAMAFAVTNHAMVALVLWLAHGIRPSASGVISLESMEMDLALAAVGVAIVVSWQVHPSLIVLQIVPMFLFHRALAVPQLQEEAHYDAKTGLLATRRFTEVFREELARAVRAGTPLSIAMADLDFFRNINNSLGHLAGDEVLRGVAGVLKKTLRTGDVLGRFGGEEFVLLLKDAPAAGALAAAERVRAAVERTPLAVTASPEPVRVTVSLGVASFPYPCPDAESLVHLADLALYRSKDRGRNRVTLASPAAEATPEETSGDGRGRRKEERVTTAGAPRG